MRDSRTHPAVVLAASLLAASTAVAKDVTLVKNGKARATIYSPLEAEAPPKEAKDNPSRARLRASIADLALYLGKISGAKLEIVHGAPPARPQTIPILIGELGEKRFGKPAVTSPFKQAFRLVVSKSAVACIGESDEATSYAIYEILDRLGCRWYMPGDFGEVIPETSTIKLPVMDFSHKPFTVKRGIWYASGDYKRRNRLGGIYHWAAHGLEGWITDEQKKEHPDWNAEIKGKRTPGRICWGNPEVAKAVADNIIKSLGERYRTCVTVSPGDGMTFCQCAKCKAFDAGDWDPSMACVSLTDRFIHFCNQIAEHTSKKHPEVILGMLAYVQYTRPPVREKVHPLIVPQLAPITYCRAHSMAHPDCPSCQSLRPIVEGWGKASRMLSMYQYGYNLAEVSCPFPMIAKWSRDLPILFANNVQLWTPETMPNFESTLPGMYLGVRMSWYTDAKPKEILDEFFARFYGATAEPMERYWRTIDDAWAKVPEHAGCRFGHPVRFTPEVMATARKAIDAALVASSTEDEYRRVRIVDDSFREFELYMKMLRDFNEGRWRNLDQEMQLWDLTWHALRRQYSAQSAFSPYGSTYLGFFNKALYQEATRLTKEARIMTKPIRKWRLQIDKEKKGEELGWFKPEFDDKEWKTTDPCIETWSSLGLFEYFGDAWYRVKLRIPGVYKGKKVFLWLGGTDGSTKLFVNGRHVQYVNKKGETVESHGGFCAPAAFDITSVVKPNADNVFVTKCTRWDSYINELGTGGLMGPVVIYQEK